MNKGSCILKYIQQEDKIISPAEDEPRSNALQINGAFDCSAWRGGLLSFSLAVAVHSLK